MREGGKEGGRRGREGGTEGGIEDEREMDILREGVEGRKKG